MRESIKFILFGFGVIGYLIGYGINYTLAMVGVALAFEGGIIDETIFNVFKYGYLVIGILIFIGFIFYFSGVLGKKQLCSNCNTTLQSNRNEI